MNNQEIQDKELKYIKMKVSDLLPYARNSKKHDEMQVNKIASSIKEFGFINPVIINQDNTILCGHGRVLAAKKLGLEIVPCLIADHLTEAQKKAYIIADNKLTEVGGTWDNEMLKVEIEDLKANDFDVEILGFSDKELSKLFDAGKETEEDDFDLNKALDEKAFAKIGDVWLLGKHRLMCGDSTKQDDVKVLMDGNKANSCITDAPYNVNYEGGTGLKIKNDSFKNGEDFFNFLLAVYKNAYESLVDGGTLYAFHSDSEKVNFFNSIVGAGFHYSTTCIWVKDRFVLGRGDFQQMHEPCVYAFKDTAKHEWYSDRKQSTVWNFDRPMKSELHPTQKPIPLIAYPMRCSTQENGLVLDLFGGSGTTLIAAEQLNRISFLMEIDPKYASAIVRRYVCFKGNKTDDVFVLRNGEKINCLDIYDPSKEEFTYKEGNVDDKSRKEK